MPNNVEQSVVNVELPKPRGFVDMIATIESTGWDLREKD